MKKIFLNVCALLTCVVSVHAQETYENTRLVDNDLNGTARYVGMGGAMEALGADISTMGTNPAGIGLFRRSVASASFGLVTQDQASDFKYGDKTKMSFDQAGFVYAMRSGRRSFMNFGFNYHKSKNFNYILSTADHLSGASQNKLSFIKALGDVDRTGVTEVNINESSGAYRGTNYFTSQLDNLYYNALMMTNGNLYYNDASSYTFDRANTGYIGEYDFNMSGNINDRVYLGLTVGIHDVHYKGQSLYSEQLLNAADHAIGDVTVSDERRITGVGYSVSAGVIFRPVEASPFRIGLYVTSPTWYDLTTRNYTYLINNSQVEGANPRYYANESYDYKVYTPWKFGVSLGHTVDNFLALGATYEYADYGSLDSRVNDGSYVDYFGDIYDQSHSDDNMNRHTKATLKGVSTLKVGAEVKLPANFTLRAGYNYVSPMFRADGYKDGSLDSYGSNYSSATDYTNWKETNRYTLGLGYTVDKFSFDFAFQHSQTDGDFHPFMDSYADYFVKNDAGVVQKMSIDNYAKGVKVSNKRNQLLLTMTYRF